MRIRPLKLLLVCGAPLALVAGVWLRVAAPLPPEVRMPAARAALEESARRHAAWLGLDASDGDVWINLEEEVEARILAARAEAPGVVALLNPGYRVEASLKSGTTGVSLTMNPHGHLLGFEAAPEDGRAPVQMPEEEVKAAAEEAVREWLAFAPGVTVSPLAVSARGRRNRFTFEVLPGTMPEARFTGFVMMQGTRPVGGRLRPEFERAFAARYEKPTALRNSFSASGAVVVVFFTFYALFLYRRRAREKEAPRGRARMLVLLFALLGGGSIALNFESVAQFDTPGDELPWYVSLMAALGGGLVMAMAGVLVGAAYGSGEGQIRERFPGKMTSFDALLAGRVRNRNVGWSVTAGAAAAGWAMLLVGLAGAWLGPRAVVLMESGHVLSSFGKLPWLGSVMSVPLEVAFTTVAGLFMPMTFALRRFRSSRARWTVLLFCATLVSVGFGSHVFVAAPRLVEALVGVAVLIAPFFLVDLLASLTATSLFLLAMHTSALAALAPWMWTGVLVQLLLVTMVLAVLAASALGNETVTEEEVKPQHARNLEQRLSMRSEISAAREAQLRLLPGSPPRVNGLTVAASCSPTGDVGADFYDFFPLPGGRLVVFVASGGGLGVASALTIALAKGYLMSDLRRADDLAASLARLRRLLSDRVGEVAQRARFALVRIDPSTGVVEAARWGEVPGVWLLDADSGGAQELEFAHGEYGLPRARTALRVGDGLVLHTEGLISALEDQSPAGLRAWFGGLCPHGVLEAEVLHALVLKRLAGGNQKVLQRRLRSDLTAVTVRLEPAAVMEKESAA
jgi:hypothetical protein